MRNLWLKLGCYLTGYNYFILQNSSEASAKTVKKYLSALLIISLIWGFVGYNFSQRYLHTGLGGSLIAAGIMIIMIIQIERQIILSMGKNNWVVVFRIIIGLIMAILGSVIMDQIMFREDVEKYKISHVQEEANLILPQKTLELDNQIRQIDSAIFLKETERTSIINEITKIPFVRSTTSETKHIPVKITGKDGEKRDTLLRRTDYTLTDITNPKVKLLPDIEKQISLLHEQKSLKENSKINIREDLEKELRSKTGFLDELKLLFEILLSSGIALAMWILFFVFFLAIELFVLVNKFGEKENDYDAIIVHQKNVRIRMIGTLPEDNKLH